MENTVKISAADVKKLRQATGAGMMDCKNALVEAEGNFDKAIEVLRKKGQKVAAKRADRDSSEGVAITKINDDNTAGVAIVLACETDFVSKNDYEKWRKMVPEKKVGGIQLMADKGLKSEFMKAFSVGLIPRSILLDEEGKIILEKAPRPSDKSTKQYLDNILKRKKNIKMQ